MLPDRRITIEALLAGDPDLPILERQDRRELGRAG
jgi:hypothetical protein